MLFRSQDRLGGPRRLASDREELRSARDAFGDQHHDTRRRILDHEIREVENVEKKGWMMIETSWSDGNDWWKAEAEMREKNGVYYMILRRVSSSSQDMIASLQSEVGTWYILPEDVGGPWFHSSFEALKSIDGNMTRFKKGYSYSFPSTPVSLDTLSLSVPSYVYNAFIDGTIVSGKIDTNKDGKFEFGTLSAATSHATLNMKIQRKYRTVYTEAPMHARVMTPDNEIYQLFFEQLPDEEQNNAETPDWMEPLRGKEGVTHGDGTETTENTAMKKDWFEPLMGTEGVTHSTTKIIPSFTSEPILLKNDEQSQNRDRIRSHHNLNIASKPLIWNTQTFQGHESFFIWTSRLAQSLRTADIEESYLHLHEIKPFTKIDDIVPAMKTLFWQITNEMKKNRSVEYVFLMTPTQQSDEFTFILDNYSLLDATLFDANNNGIIEIDELPMQIGTRLKNSNYIPAKNGPMIEESKDEISLFIPVKSDDGRTIAILGAMQQR